MVRVVPSPVAVSELSVELELVIELDSVAFDVGVLEVSSAEPKPVNAAIKIAELKTSDKAFFNLITEPTFLVLLIGIAFVCCEKMSAIHTHSFHQLLCQMFREMR